MLRWIALTALTLAAALTGGCTGEQTPAPTKPGLQTQPYAGLEGRPVKALVPDRVADLLAGRGAGYALAAELNHYPGPTHVLELARDLQLRPDQEQRVREVFSSMQQDARRYGEQLVNLETDLDQMFSSGAITPTELEHLTGEIAAVEGRLRETHLAAHLEMKHILTTEQVARYDQLRGYGTGDDGSGSAKDGHAMAEHGGHRGD